MIGSVFEANCQCFTNRPLIGIITKIDSPYANVPMVRNWMVNSGCERIFEVSNLTREGIQELLDYLQEVTPNMVTKYLGQFAFEVLEPLGIEYRTKRTGKSRLIKFLRRDGDDTNDAGIAI